MDIEATKKELLGKRLAIHDIQMYRESNCQREENLGDLIGAERAGQLTTGKALPSSGETKIICEYLGVDNSQFDIEVRSGVPQFKEKFKCGSQQFYGYAHFRFEKAEVVFCIDHGAADSLHNQILTGSKFIKLKAMDNQSVFVVRDKMLGIAIYDDTYGSYFEEGVKVLGSGEPPNQEIWGEIEGLTGCDYDKYEQAKNNLILSNDINFDLNDRYIGDDIWGLKIEQRSPYNISTCLYLLKIMKWHFTCGRKSYMDLPGPTDIDASILKFIGEEDVNMKMIRVSNDIGFTEYVSVADLDFITLPTRMLERAISRI